MLNRVEVVLQVLEREVAVRAPLAAIEDQDDRSVREAVAEMDLPAELVGKRKVRSVIADLDPWCGAALPDFVDTAVEDSGYLGRRRVPELGKRRVE
jgi:hypothetical protein